MEQILDRISEDLGVIHNHLREALNKGNAVDSIIVLRLISLLTTLQSNVNEFLDAKIADK